MVRTITTTVMNLYYREQDSDDIKVARGMPPAALKAQFGDTYYYYAQFTPTPKRQ